MQFAVEILAKTMSILLLDEVSAKGAICLYHLATPRQGLDHVVKKTKHKSIK